ncbi:hypothetical protein [Nocardioides yefusunii]|uniref:HTH luxR-type domain-containing protein n=1 Tax=Nocardioides yefusunii TaxID=2500546 RepID=A0ABW1R3Q6_9ACTN|nr:hypothetical protein [Nocardioides yefusunii]
MARNKVLQEFQRRTRRHHDHRFLSDWDEMQPVGEGDVSADVAERDRAHLTYQSLSSTEKRLFEVAFMQGLAPSHGAARLEISPSSFTTKVFRLRRRIAALQDAD